MYISIHMCRPVQGGVCQWEKKEKGATEASRKEHKQARSMLTAEVSSKARGGVRADVATEYERR
jgi:hypothetical protein